MEKIGEVGRLGGKLRVEGEEVWNFFNFFRNYNLQFINKRFFYHSLFKIFFFLSRNVFKANSLRLENNSDLPLHPPLLTNDTLTRQLKENDFLDRFSLNNGFYPRSSKETKLNCRQRILFFPSPCSLLIQNFFFVFSYSP